MAACAAHVRVREGAIPSYAASLPLDDPPDESDPESLAAGGDRERLAAFWITLDAINFGSGWFPTLRKHAGRSGYHTIAAGLAEHGPWTAEQLGEIDAREVARALGQDPAHELMGLFAASLRNLGDHVGRAGSFSAVVDSSAVTLVQRLAGWDCFADTSRHGELELPFLKRAQITAADLHRAGVTRLRDLHRLTMFADNLVPHVLRLDGVLEFERGLVDRIDRGELLEHGSAQEVEIRACAVHAVELIVAERPRATAAQIDQLLWGRGGQPRYKARRRHRCRCTAY